MADLALAGHPFRGLWQQLAGDLGITTPRMREIALDRQAEQEQQLRGANIALAEIIRSGTPEEQAIAAQRMRDVAQATSANIRSIGATGRPQFNVPAAADLVAPFYAARSQAQAASQAEQYATAKAQLADRNAMLRDVQKGLDTSQTQYDTFVEGLNSLGAQDDTVQSNYRELRGLPTAAARGQESPFNFRIFGFGYKPEAEEKAFSYDEMVKGASAWLTGQQKQLLARQQALLQAPLEVGVPQYSAPLSVPTQATATAPASAPPGTPTPAASAGGQIGTNVMDFLGGFGEATGGRLGQQTGQAIRSAFGVPELTKDEAGNLVQKVDLGEGRYMWRPYNPKAARTRREGTLGQVASGVIQRPVNQ